MEVGVNGIKTKNNINGKRVLRVGKLENMILIIWTCYKGRLGEETNVQGFLSDIKL